MPHDTGRAYKDAAARCRLGSNRLVTLDVTVRKWQEGLEGGHAETGHRRKTTVRRKPKVAVAPAVSQIAAQKQASADGTFSNNGPLWALRKEQWAATESAVRDTDARRAQLPKGAARLGASPLPAIPRSEC
ncbi:hypothetical protein ACH4L9_34750 [Streptomyces globisporus]|uniref:hypothetical protein n=1 Tax=Streptomyces globisporus TaxID=1908 RepID=UPI0037BBD97A